MYITLSNNYIFRQLNEPAFTKVLRRLFVKSDFSNIWNVWKAKHSDDIGGQEATVKCGSAYIYYFYTCTVEAEVKTLHFMRVTLRISVQKRKKKAVNLNVFHLWLSVLSSEVFPKWGEGTWKRYLSMTEELELVKATKCCCQNHFCLVTQL